MIRNIIAATFILLTLPMQVALADGRGGKPMIYSSNSDTALEVIRDQIATQTGWESVFSRGGSAVMMRRIAKDRNPTADIFWSASASTLGDFLQEFQPYDAPALAQIPPQLYCCDNRLLPSSIHVVTFMVNSDRLHGTPLPTSWQDLADPVWKGRIIVAHPANSSTGYAILFGLRKMMDRDTYQRLVENMVISETSTAVHEAVAAGDYAVGLTFEANAYTHIQSGKEEVSMIYPSDGTFLTVDYTGVLQQAPMGRKALQVMDSLLSRETQVALLKSAYRRPSRSDIRVLDHVPLPELTDMIVFPIDEAEAAAGRQDFLARWATLSNAGEVGQTDVCAD